MEEGIVIKKFPLEITIYATTKEGSLKPFLIFTNLINIQKTSEN